MIRTFKINSLRGFQIYNIGLLTVVTMLYRVIYLITGSFYILTAAAKSLQSCPTLCDPIDGSLSGLPVPGILQARTLEWVAIAFSNAWKWKVKVKSESEVAQLYPTLSDPMDCSLPASSVHGIFQARVPLPSPTFWLPYGKRSMLKNSPPNPFCVFGVIFHIFMFIPSLIIVVILSFILFLSFNLHNNLFKWLILNLYYISVFTSGIFSFLIGTYFFL